MQESDLYFYYMGSGDQKQATRLGAGAFTKLKQHNTNAQTNLPRSLAWGLGGRAGKHLLHSTDLGRDPTQC